MRSRLYGVLRAAATLVVITAVALGAALRTAQARIGEALLGYGGALSQLVEGHLHSGTRQLTVNGLDFRVVSASTPLSVHDALERVGELCRSRGGLSAPIRALNALGLSVLDGTLRQESERQGVIACLDTGRPLELAELSARLTQLRDTGDLRALGELRYVLARRTGKTTTLLAMWTEGQAELLKMFPKKGDAPGRDPEGILRPPQSRRLLFAAEHAMPYAITMYAVEGRSTQALREWYRTTLEGQGWAVEPTGESGALVARRAGHLVVVCVSRASKRTTVTLAELA